MSMMMIGSITLALLMLMVLMGWQIAVCLMIASVVGIWLTTGDLNIAITLLGQTSYHSLNKFSLGVLPLFILMGLLANMSGASSDLFATSNILLKKVRGGLAIATIVANAFFAAITGVTFAAAAVFTKIALPEMAKRGYDKSFAAGTVAGGSVIGMLIPPSLLMIIYGPLAEVSIGRLFIAGVFPGLLLAIVYIVGIYLMSYYQPGKLGVNFENTETEKNDWHIIVRPWPIIALILVVLGGIWLGFFTPTEAGGIGAFGAFILALAKRKVTGPALFKTLLDTGVASGSIFILLVAAQMYSRMLAMSGIVGTLSMILAGVDFAPIAMVLIFMVAIIIMGTVLDSISILLLTMPLMVPVVASFGMDLIWFGVIAILATQIGLVTPPFGLAVFTIKSSLPEEYNAQLEVEDIFRGSFPFFAMMVVCLLILVLIPSITTYLPSLM